MSSFMKTKNFFRLLRKNMIVTPFSNPSTLLVFLYSMIIESSDIVALVYSKQIYSILFSIIKIRALRTLF